MKMRAQPRHVLYRDLRDEVSLRTVESAIDQVFHQISGKTQEQVWRQDWTDMYTPLFRHEKTGIQ